MQILIQVFYLFSVGEIETVVTTLSSHVAVPKRQSTVQSHGPDFGICVFQE